MQLKPEALNSLKLPVRVKAGFLGSVKLKVPWSRLGQEPVLVYLDRIFILAEPATQVEGCSEDAVQEAKRSRVREMEIKLLESQQQLQSELSSSWLGSFISTIIGNIKLFIGNIHIRYEDGESNPGHPFASGLVLSKLSAVTVDDLGKETFATGGALDRVKKYLKDSIDQIIAFFKSSPTISQTLALETAAAVQMTLDELKRTAQQQMTQVLKDQSRFSLNMDIAAPKITVPTKFRPDDVHETKLLLDLGNLVLRTEEIWDSYTSEDQDIYLNFNVVLSDVSAFLVDGDYHWNETPNEINLLPVIDKCGIALKFQQVTALTCAA